MNSTGMKTAASESVIDTMVKPISPDPLREASRGRSPSSMCRFSSMTMASSTTKPTERISAIIERLSRLKLTKYISAKVPMIEKGSARLGMMVAERFRRNRKITMTTSPRVSTMVNSTSRYDSRIVSERSYKMSMLTEGGSSVRKTGRRFLTPSVTSMVLVPGWRWMARTMARLFALRV